MAWGLGLLSISQRGGLVVCTTHPMSHASDWRCIVAYQSSHICPVSAAGRVLRLPSSSSCVKSSDCRTIGRSPGCIRSEKWWEGSQVSALLGGETVGSRSSSGFDWALYILLLHPNHSVQALGPLPPGGCRLTKNLEPHPVSLWVDIIPAQSCWDTLSTNPCPTDWGGWGDSWVLMEFVPGQGAPVQCLHKSFLGPDFSLSSSVSVVAWVKYCHVSSVQCFSALPTDP
jgi:hypothetical protein